MKLNKAQQALAYLRSLVVSTDLAEEIHLKDYEAKDGTKISTDDAGKVQGDVADGDHELADGSTLTVKDGVAALKPTDEAPKEAEKTAADPAPADDAPAADAPQEDAKPEDTLKQSIDALTAAIQQMLASMGLKEQELAEGKTKLAETETKLAEAEKQVEEAESKPVDRKPAVGLGLTAIQDEAKLTKGQRALAAARAAAGR